MEEVGVAGSGKKPGNDQTIIAGLAMTAASVPRTFMDFAILFTVTFIKTIELVIQPCEYSHSRIPLSTRIYISHLSK
jgi:hypothetical protein